jgi:phosphoglycerate dehydrogenase-like enzyme
MAQYCFGYILQIERNLLMHLDNQRRHKWEPLNYRELHTLKLGILVWTIS